MLSSQLPVVEKECKGTTGYGKYNLLLDASKTCFLDGTGKVIGRISNGYLCAVDCVKKCTPKQKTDLCSKCRSLLQSLENKLEKVKQIIDNPELQFYLPFHLYFFILK